MKMSKQKKKRGRKILIIMATILGVIVFINAISFVSNRVFFSHELDGMLPYGELVNVNDKNMHIYSMVKGEKTIVFYQVLEFQYLV